MTIEEKKGGGEPVAVKHCSWLGGACMMPGGSVCSACSFNLDIADRFIDIEDGFYDVDDRIEEET